MLYESNYTMDSFSSKVFSARRLPDRVHHRIVKCNSCGLVRSDPATDSDSLARLYGQSEFTYDAQIADLKITYGRFLANLNRYKVNKQSLLEIGSGNGFFLEEAFRQGYKYIRGIEHSEDAIQKASPIVRPNLVCDVMRPGLFPGGTFDVICMFQVFDHVADPNGLLKECWNILKPGGFILSVNHNVAALSARLLKENSPIIDIEHPYLYSLLTMRKIFAMHGFVVHEVKPVRNRYNISYLVHLLPVRSRLKTVVLNRLRQSAFGRIPIPIWLGNLRIIAQKPEDDRLCE